MKQIETQGLDRFAGALLVQNRKVVEKYLRILGNDLEGVLTVEGGALRRPTNVL
jgi:hypothetical protein